MVFYFPRENTQSASTKFGALGTMGGITKRFEVPISSRIGSKCIEIREIVVANSFFLTETFCEHRGQVEWRTPA